MSLEDKKKLLGNLVKKIQKDNGDSKHALSFASDRLDELKYEFIPTPSENVNMALGNGTTPGGFARGKIIEVAGENSSGKSSLLLETIADDHKNDPDSIWGWLNAESDFDEEYAQMKGVDMNRLIIWDVDDTGAEKSLDTLEMLIRSHALKAIVVNSIAALVPKKELENEMEKQEVALQARMMSKLMRKITAISNRTKTTVIFINQYRTNVGQMFGNPDTTTGGRALTYFATQRIGLRKVKLQKEDGITDEEGLKINVHVMKNRASYNNPFKKTSYTAIFGEGIDAVREIANIALETPYATSGSWIYLAADGNPAKDNFDTWNGHELKWNGKAKFLDFIRDNPEFQDHLKDLIRGNAQMESLSDEEIAALKQEERELELEMADLGVDLEEDIETA